MTSSTKDAQSTFGPAGRGGAVPLLVLEAGGAIPLYEQIHDALRDQLLRGRLRPGARLASSRVLADALGVSRFTVVQALERLLAEGYLVGRAGAGTFVVDTLPERLMRASPRRRSTRGGPRAATPAPSTPVPERSPELSARGRAMSAVVITGPRRESDEPRAFRPRRPAIDLFPAREWARLLRAHWRSCRHEHLDYGEPAGLRRLREAIAAHVGLTRGVSCSWDQVIVTSGSQQAFDILFRLVLEPGDPAWIEEPGYLDVRGALVAAGARLVPVPVDEQGIVVAEGVLRAPDARLAVVSPSHQYPSGATLSLTRRAALLAWARQAGAWIVEDDYDSYFRYRGRPCSALQPLDALSSPPPRFTPRVLYVGTFSKTMFPSLRIGFCVVPDALVDAAANARAVAGRNCPIVDQAALADFLLDGHYDRHLRRVRLAYQERHQAMQAHFGRRLGEAVELLPASAGTHVIGRLVGARPGLADRVAAEAAREDLVVFPLGRYCIAPPAEEALVLGYGGLSPQRIARGVERLARALDRARAS